MKKRYAIAVLALAVIAITVVSLQSSRTGTGDETSADGQNHRPEAATSQTSAGADSMSVAPAQSGRPLLQLPEVFEEARHRAENPRDTWSPGSDEGSLDGALQRMHENNPTLGKFHTLRSKALRTSEEQQQYLDMMADPAMLTAARNNLLAALQGTEITQEAELERVMQIRYLSSAMTWEGNPQRDQVVASMTELVLAELPVGLPPDVRGSLLGDKMELYQYLVLNNPALADELLARVKGTKLEPVLLAARKMIEPANSDVPSNGQL
jgi:hypothetical protein